MRPLLALLTSFSLANGLVAQDHQPLEKARKAAQLIHQKASALKDAQIEIKVDLDKPYLVTGSDNLGALVIPDKKLENKTQPPFGDKPIAIGQLWMRGLAPVVDGDKVPREKLRVIRIATDDENVELTGYLLAAVIRENSPTLLVYGNAKKPIAWLKLKKAKTLQELPLELDAIGENGSATLYFNLVGHYIAEMTIAAK